MLEPWVNSSATQPQISIVIPVRNEGERLRQMLLSVVRGRSHLFPVELVIVDDSSEDGCCDRVSGLFKWNRDRVSMRVIRNAEWSGIPFARNVGAAAASSELLFITDGNLYFPRDWDVAIRRAIRPDVALCATIADFSSKFKGYGCTLQLPSMGVKWLRTPIAYNGYVPVAPCSGTIIPRRLFQRVGGYDNGMPLYGAAEPEFSVRLWLSGGAIIALPELVLTHYFRPALARESFLSRASRILLHNYIRFGLLYLSELQAVKMLHHYAWSASPESFRDALRRAENGGVWSRREFLANSLPHNFSAYIRRFGIEEQPA